MSNVIYCLAVYNIKSDYHQAPFQATNLKEAVAQFIEVISRDEQPLSKNKDDYALVLVSKMETRQIDGKEKFNIENHGEIVAYGREIAYKNDSPYYKQIPLPLRNETPTGLTKSEL